MIGIALAFALFQLVKWRGMWRKKQWRDWIVQNGLMVIGLGMAAMVHWRLNVKFDPLAPIVYVFSPLTKWIYELL